VKAMVIREFGAPEVFTQTQLQAPQLCPGHVLINVMATSINPVDTKIRQGKLAAIAPDFPAVLHGDVSGSVAAVADDVQGFAVGDKVISCGGGVRGTGGALADQMLVDARLLAPAPAKMDLAQSAALPLVGITAWTALMEKAKLQAGQSVLIHGATGGVSHIGIQLARSRGAQVYATCSSAEKAAIAKRLGAHECFLYRQQNVAEYVQQATDGKGFDVVFDTVGGDNIQQSFQAAALNGTVVSVSTRSTQDLSLMHSKGLSLHVVFMLIPLLHNVGRAGHGEILRQLVSLVDQGELTLLLDKERFGFNEVAKAHRYFETQTAQGKVLLLND